MIKQITFTPTSQAPRLVQNLEATLLYEDGHFVAALIFSPKPVSQEILSLGTTTIFPKEIVLL